MTKIAGRKVRSPGNVLSWLVQTLPNTQSAQVFTTLETAFLRAFRLRTGVIVPNPGVPAFHVHSAAFGIDPRDAGAVELALREGTPAGYGTMHAPNAAAMFLPLSSSSTIVGALGIAADPRLPAIAHPGSLMFRGFCGQAVLSILRFNLNEQARQARLLHETDLLQKALLSSIAHNVRTPLASILGSLSTLRDEPALLDDATRRNLVDNALTETERLNRLLRNLLDLGRLEAGAVRARMDPCDIQDLIGAAIEQLGPAASRRIIHTDLQPDLPFVRLDFVLILQVVANLLDNAVKYSSESRPVIVDARVHDDSLRVSVLDEGDGIPQHELANVFEKFNRGGRTGETGGLGLGLSICRGLIQTHHGNIWAERREPRGTAVIFTIPLRAAPGSSNRQG
jgi:two-component system sensor histidine kinase KdpD